MKNALTIPIALSCLIGGLYIVNWFGAERARLDTEHIARCISKDKSLNPERCVLDRGFR